MHGHQLLRRTILLMAAASTYAGCGEENSGTGPTTTSGSTEQFFGGLNPWSLTIPDTTAVPPRTIAIDSVIIDNGVLYSCTVEEYKLKKNFNDLVSVGINSGVLWPGALIQGRSLRDGVLSEFHLPRSPLTLSIDLALEDPTEFVDNPTSASVQAAVANLQRRADSRFGSNRPDILPARLRLSKQEAFSSSQATLAAGLNLKYNAGVSVTFDAAFSADRSLEVKTIVVRFYQPMYTISFADEEFALPSDFFHPSVTVEDFHQQQRLGTVGPSNQPTYVKSVTYGRMMMFTMSSTSVASADSLGVAVTAALGAFDGGGNIDLTRKNVLETSNYEMVALGGIEAAALAAIRSGKLEDYFDTANPLANAVPLSYRINVLQDRSLAILGDNTTYSVKTCTPQLKYRFRIVLEDVKERSNCVQDNTPTIVASVVDDPRAVGSPLEMLNDTLQVWGTQLPRSVYVNRGVDDGADFKVRSRLGKKTTQTSMSLSGTWHADPMVLTDFGALPRTLVTADFLLTDNNGSITGNAFLRTTTTGILSQCNYSVTGARGASVDLRFVFTDGEFRCNTEVLHYRFTAYTGSVNAGNTTLTGSLVDWSGVKQPGTTFRRSGAPPTTQGQRTNELPTTFSSPYDLPSQATLGSDGSVSMPFSHIFSIAREDGAGQCSVEFSYTIHRTPVFLLRGAPQSLQEILH